MQHTHVLQEHDRVCQDIHECVLDENRFLRQHQRAPGADMVARKRALQERLDASLNAVRQLPAGPRHDADARTLLERTRSRILQVLHLDRENEQLLLRCSLATARGAPTAPSAAMLQHIYGRR